ncbi:serine/threonine-protein phosphatase 4 regulatory subunit 1-like [Tubulanus polymorphus]|uniref:serine/threonine-protein phosphatase 4 regulatory subunit 1-like n=1 Tax=Tubulanus polymorphus TaxID=672921 RepID=UPI003DA3CFEA
MQMDNIFSRQMLARSLLDTICSVGEDEEEAVGVLKAIMRLADDPDASVRSELMEQVPHIAKYCQENRQIFADAIPSYLLPLVVKYLTDTNNQVRKTSQAALLVLLEQDLVDRGDVEEQVCPIILDLTSFDSLDVYRTEAVALMSKMASLVGRDITERIFLPQFTMLCTDTLFHVRKVCAANFGDMCRVVGQEATEEHMLPKFHYLCEDGVWGVRKACAECFTSVSCASCPEIRKQELATLFINLLRDQSRWVRIAAFEALGPFISTFADPSITGLFFDDEGVLRYKPSTNGDDDCDSDDSKSSSSDEADINAALGQLEHSSSTADSNNCDIQQQQQQQKNMDLDVTVSNNSSNYIHVIPTGAKSENSSSSDDNPVTHNGSGDQSSETSVEEYRALKYFDEKREEDLEDYIENKQETSSSSSIPIGGCTTDESSSDQIGETVKHDDDEEDKGVSLLDIIAQVVDKNEDSLICSEESTAPESDEKSVTKTEKSQSDSAEKVHIHLDNIAHFSDFNFWNMPLPEIDLDLDLVAGKPANIHVVARLKDTVSNQIVTAEKDIDLSDGAKSGEQTTSESTQLDELSEKLHDTQIDSSVNASSDDTTEEQDEASSTVHVASVSLHQEEPEIVTHIGSTHVLGQQIHETAVTLVGRDGSSRSVNYADNENAQQQHHHHVPCTPDTSLMSTNSDNLFDDDDDAQFEQYQNYLTQDVIPQSLLDHYLSMIDPTRAQTVDTEIARHCAFSLPAVAYTLGRGHWPCLRETYKALAADMQWKVRRTLAFSIHELGVILGDGITNRDLVPIFNDFLKDLDEVKIGAVRHLAEFIQLLVTDQRQHYLYKLPDIMATDNNRNWRYRMLLAEQLILMCDMYSSDDISEHLVHVSMALVSDKVAEVRRVAYRLVSVVLKKFYDEKGERFLVSFVDDLVDKYGMSCKWYGRQTYCQLCENILENKSLPDERFARDLLPTLNLLGADLIPNVRISLAKTLAKYVINSEYFTSYKNPHHEELLRTIQTLKSDADKDVRHFISHPPDSNSQHIEDTVPV